LKAPVGNTGKDAKAGVAVLGESLKMALRSLVNNRMRTALTMLGIIIGVASVVALMAIGARGFDVLFQFLTEAVMVCFLGGLIGVFVGIGCGLGISALAGWRVIFTFTPIIIAFGFAFLTGIIFGYLSAKKAARLDPIEALARD